MFKRLCGLSIVLAVLFPSHQNVVWAQEAQVGQSEDDFSDSVINTPATAQGLAEKPEGVQDGPEGVENSSEGTILSDMEKILSSIPSSDDDTTEITSAIENGDMDKNSFDTNLSPTMSSPNLAKEQIVEDMGVTEEAEVNSPLEVVEASTSESMEEEEKSGQSSSDVFVDFVAPMIKYRMMSTGNKTEGEADAILDTITSRMNVSSSKSSNISSNNPFASGSFFTDYISPIIRQGMLTTGNKTEEEANVLISIISNAVETKSKIQNAFKEKLSTLKVSSNDSNGSLFSTVDFFQNYIAPIIRVGIVTSGNKSETEANFILDKITTAMINRTSSDVKENDAADIKQPKAKATGTSADVKITPRGNLEDVNGIPYVPEDKDSVFNTSAFFNDYIEPIIKFGMMTHGNKSEIEADAVLDIISSSLKMESNTKNESQSQGGMTVDPAAFFKDFISPFIRQNMISAQNKTADEADAILNIISTSMAMRSVLNKTTVHLKKSGSFFANYIAPIIRFGMINSGNKTESEADKIVQTITSSITNRTLSGPKSTDLLSDFGITDSVNLFDDFISPLIKYRMMSTGNKTESEAGAMINIISTSKKKKSAAASKNEKIEEEQLDNVGAMGVKKNISFFEEFVVPIIRYSIIHNGNKTAEEADAVLNIISTNSNKPNSSSKQKSGNFFEDLIAPILRHKIIGEGTKNESEVDAIVNSIIISEREKEALKVSDELGITDGDAGEFSTENVTHKFIDGILLPEIKKAIYGVSDKDGTSKTMTEVDDVEIAEASKVAVIDIIRSLVDAVDSQDNVGDEDGKSTTREEEQNASSEYSSEESKDSENSVSSDESKASENSVSSEGSKDSENSVSSDESNASDQSASSGSWKKSEEGGSSDERKEFGDSTSQESEDSGSKQTSETSGESTEDKTKLEVETFVKNYLGPVLSERITALKTMSTFFANPTVLQELQKSLKEMFATEGTNSENNQESSGTGVTASNLGIKNSQSANSSPVNPLTWFVEQLVIPHLQKMSEQLSNLAQKIDLEGKKSLSSSSNFSEGKENPGNAQFISEVLIPKMKAAVQRFRNLTKSLSSSDGKTAITNGVKDLINRILDVKSPLSVAKNAGVKQNFYEKMSSASQEQETIPGNSFGVLAGDMVASAFKSSGQKLKTLADKMSNPVVSTKIANILKTKINTAIQESKKKRCTDSSCSGSLESNMESSTNETPEEIIKQIVEMKFRISKDRIKCEELDKQISLTGVFDENMDLIVEKLKYVQDIKNCSVVLRNLFIRLRTDTFSKNQNIQSIQLTEFSIANNDPYSEIRNDIVQITQTKSNVIVYREKLNEMDRELYQQPYNPDRLKLVQNKLKLVWGLKGETSKLNNLYEKLRLDQLAVRQQEEKEKMESEAQSNAQPTNFEIEFTEAEKAKYAGVLKELNFAQSTPNAEGEDSDGNFVMGLWFTCLVAVVMGTVGIILVRRRNRRQRLYTFIPSEDSLDPKTFIGPKETYGACK